VNKANRFIVTLNPPKSSLLRIIPMLRISIFPKCYQV
jgi:hypothetical protein